MARSNLKVEGPFAHALGGDNLILKAAKAALAMAPNVRLGRFRLVKLLPVAAGLGGGSADAAAALATDRPRQWRGAAGVGTG